MVKFEVILTFIALASIQVGGLPIADRAEELSGNFEGDMVLSKSQEMALAGHRNGLLDEQYRWPNKTVLYRIIPDNFTTSQVNYIHKALDTISNASCLSFAQADENATAYVRVIGDEGGCYSSVGFTGSIQDLNLAPDELESGCFRLGTIMHEFLHALGFFHMQSASERDDYVEIVWENIRQGTEHNFEKYDTKVVTNFEMQYDYGSVLHYSETAFSVNGESTIVPKAPNATIGQRVKMSQTDVVKLNRMYACS